MKGRIAGARGTRDFFPPESYKMQIVEDAFQETAHRYGYILVRTPLFERTELFTRSLGEESDLVTKEMYTFPDHRGRSLTLRPEGTAGIVRSLIEGGVRPEGFILKYYYFGNMYRYLPIERGRYREFPQVGAEALGSDAPCLDVEIISLAYSFLRELGIDGLIVSLNSIGSSNGRAEYIGRLKDFLYLKRDMLCAECQSRTIKNPLSAFSCPQNQCKEILRDAPLTFDNLADEDKRHFKTVYSSIEGLGIPYKLDSALIRSFDYYTRTVFEINFKNDTGLKDPLVGGGRYDDLFIRLGGENVPAVGFAGNTARIAEVLPKEKYPDMSKLIGGEVLIIASDEKGYAEAFKLALLLRGLKFCAAFDILSHPYDYQLKRAAQYGVKRLISIGAKEVEDGNVIVTAVDKNLRWIMSREKFANRPSALAALEGIGGRPYIEGRKQDDQSPWRT